jgi:branched-chain amino acid transport system permease protein
LLFTQIIANGLLLGGLYGLMALGMSLVWGVLNIVNLAHGAMIMLGGYMGYYLFAKAGVDPFVALLPTMILMFGVGYFLQRYLLNLIVRSAPMNMLLLTFGIQVVLTYLAQLLFSADFRAINASYAGSSITISGITIPLVRLAVCALALVLSGILWATLQYTRLGRSIRATSQNLIAARLYGIAPRQLYAVTFGIGSGLAGAAGVLYGVVSQINPYVGADLTVKSFVIVIVGGLGNPLGIIASGLIIGVVEALSGLYIGQTFTNVVTFGLLVLMLVIRPNRSLREA